MIPYILLILIPVFFTFVAVDRSQTATRIRIGSNTDSFIQQHNPALPIFFILLFLMLACRAETVGTDIRQYRVLFNTYSDLSLKYFDLFRLESLFRLLNWSVGQLTDSYQIFLTIVAGITLIPIAMLYCEDRRHSTMKIMLFVSMSTFLMLFSGIRQMIAVSLGVVAYNFVRKKQWMLFLITCVIVLGFHHSGFMVLLMYPLYHIRFKRNHLWFIVPLLAIVFIMNRQIFGLMNEVLSKVDETYEAVSSGSTGAYTMLILFVLFAVFAYIIPDESKMDEEIYGLRNFLLLTVILQCFAPLHSLSMRLNYYYIIFIPLTISKIVTIPQRQYVQLAKWASAIITVYFAMDFLQTLHHAYATGVSPLNTMPYVPFWA